MADDNVKQTVKSLKPLTADLKDPEKSPTIERGPQLGVRHVQILLIFLNIVVIYIGRLNIGVAVVAMTNANTTNPDFPEYKWTEAEKGYIFSSFYWGYVITQFPGGFLCRLYGTKVVLFVAAFITTILSAITPISIYWGGWQLFCANRAVQGLFQGVMFPAIHAHLAKWVPKEEQTRLGALAYTGIEFGVVLAFAVSGIIAESPLGWPGISYISATLCAIWCILWIIFAADNAPASKFISIAERDYIETSFKRSENFHQRKIPVPWKAICTSVPVIALLIAKCGQGWGFSIVQAELPSYMQGVLHFQIKSNALFSALPYISMWLLAYIFVAMADVIIRRHWMSLGVMRKTMNSIATWIPAIGLCLVSYLDDTQTIAAITLMTVTLGTSAGTTVGSVMNILDLSPNHTGILMGFINGIVNFLPLLTPIMVGAIVTDVHNIQQWQIIFVSSGIVMFIGNLIYVIWGSTRTQDWDAEDYMETTKKADCEKPSYNKNVIMPVVAISYKTTDNIVSEKIMAK